MQLIGLPGPFVRSARFPVFLLIVAATLVAGCADTAPTTDPLPFESHPPIEVDVHSYANANEARVTHVDLDLVADFRTRRLSGTATLTVYAAPGAEELVLDTRKLDVEHVTTVRGDPLAFKLGATDEDLGRPLTITLPRNADRIVVHYSTRPDANALQWLRPEQTAGGTHPFLFTQGQAIHTRTWIPTQDSPGIRQTYSAEITVPAELTALMSAEMLTPDGEVSGDQRTFRFRLEQPIPPYLMALAIGDLEFRAVGDRTGVWAEPSVVDSAAYEFADMPAMLEFAEELYGPYRWERFDVLVLPPSFPYGGMENPRLTFATPTLLAGDRSLVSVIAHELAHSWSGNLVTNATWDDFWLNEGFTTYLEYRIMEAVYGKDYLAMIEKLDRDKLVAELDRAGWEEPDTRLKIDLSDRGPEDSRASVAYEKGAAFLRTIEVTVGTDRFDAFLRGYFDAFAFQPMTSEQFLDYLDEHLIEGDDSLRAEIDPEAWVYGPGLPANAATIEVDAFEPVEAAAASFADGASPATLATADWTTHEWLHFLNVLPPDLSRNQMSRLDGAFDLSDSRNSEILYKWLMLAIQHEYEPARPALERFLTSQGRAKFVVPLFRALAASAWGRDFARDLFAEARPGYHPITEEAVEAVLDV